MIWLNKKTILIILMGVLVFWFLDTLIDGYFFHKYSPHRVLEYAILAPTNELIRRSFTILVIVVFALLLTKYAYHLNESEGRFRQLFDNIDDPVFVQTDVTETSPGKFVEVNQAGAQTLGYDKEELLRNSPLDIFAPEVRQDLAAQRRRILDDRAALFESVLVTKDSHPVPVEIRSHLFDFRGRTKVLSIARDISERRRVQAALKKAYDELELRVKERTAELAQANLELKHEIAERQQKEEQLRESREQLRVLTAQLLTAEEQERRRISMELHDELGQALMYLKFQMGLIAKRLQEGGKSADIDCKPILTYLDGVIENVRRLSQDLSPGVLEELGISSAIRYLLEELSKHYHLHQSTVEIDEIDDLFSHSAQIHLFRIIQESLTNILRHAQASLISVIVKRQGDQVSMVVEDNGQGFDLQALRVETRKSVGLAAMQERVRILGGSLDIRSHSGVGTKITCVIPIERKDAQHETV